MDAFGPATTFEDAPGELVDDLHLAALDDVVLVSLVQLLGLQGHGELVDDVRLNVVVQVLDLERGLDLLDALLERNDDAVVLFDLVVDIACFRPRTDPRGSGNRSSPLGALTGDDQRRAGLVDEDRVDLVDDGVVAAVSLGLVVLVCAMSSRR